MLSTRQNRFLLASPVLAVVATLVVTACSSSDAPTAPGGSSTSSTSSSGGSSTSSSSSSSTTSSSSSSSSGVGGGAPVCAPGPGFGGGEVSAVGGTVTAKLVDQDGAPVAGQPVYICGVDICSAPGKSAADGSVSITTNLMMKKPAFKFGDAVAYSELAVPLTMATTSLGTVGTGKLPASGSALTPGADAVSGGVTLSIPAGAGVSINDLIYDTPEKQQFRAVSIPIAQEGPVLDPVQVNGMSAAFELLYAVGPAQTILCPAAKVTVALPSLKMMPNDLGWAPMTKVEFWVMTVDTGQEFAPYAGWAKASDGVVSADGKTASTVDGGGFRYLDSFAIRKSAP